MNAEAPKKVRAFRIDAGALLRALSAVRPAVGHDATRPQLRAVLVTVVPKFVRFEATDGHRLHRATIDFMLSEAVVGEYRLGAVAAKDLIARAERRTGPMIVRLRPGTLGIEPAKLASLGVGGGSPAAAVDFNPDYLRFAFQAASVFGGHRAILSLHGTDEAMTIRSTGHESGEKFEAVVMPIQPLERFLRKADEHAVSKKVFDAAKAAEPITTQKESSNV